MIRFTKKGEMDKAIESMCEKKYSALLQFYTIEVNKETIYVIDDSGTPYEERLEVIELMYLKSINENTNFIINSIDEFFSITDFYRSRS